MQRLLRQLSINLRLWIIMAVALISIAIISFLAMQQERWSIMEQKSLQLSQLLELGHGTLNHYYSLAVKGELSEAQAQQKAYEVLRKLRYTTGKDSDYFSVFDRQGVAKMHPSSNLENTNMRGIKDANGFAFIADILNQASNLNQGELTYSWVKLGSTAQVEKLGAFINFEPWQVILVNGVYLDTLNDLLLQHALKLLTTVVISALTMAALIFLIARSITQPLRNMLLRTRDIAEGEGDLTHRLPLDGKDELTQINSAFNGFISKIQGLVKQTHGSSLSVSAAAEELSAVTQQSSQTVFQQEQETNQVATAMNEMTATVQEVASNAASAASAAHNATEQTSSGQKRLEETLTTLNDLDNSIQSTAKTLERLKEGTENIGVVMDVINSIAEQTNLLALNAAIEAARAGEYGRGFAVVADEVRTLASRTQEGTTEIQNMIDSLVSEADHSCRAMSESSKKAAETVNHAQETALALQKVDGDINLIADMCTQIASAAEQQAAVADEINRNIVNISELSTQTSEASNHTMEASQDLARLAEGLNQQVSQFKT